MRAVTYARSAAVSQQQRGLTEQQAELAAYCQRRGLTLVEQVADEGASGNAEERPGLNRVRELIEAGEADTVIALRSDRLSRNPGLLQRLKAWFRSKGAEVLFTEEEARR
jgi:DNA invertase Pin-like site-specific DNA recombinase